MLPKGRNLPGPYYLRSHENQLEASMWPKQQWQSGSTLTGFQDTSLQI